MAMTNVCETGKGERKGTDKLLVLEWPTHNVFYTVEKFCIFRSYIKKREHKGTQIRTYDEAIELEDG